MVIAAMITACFSNVLTVHSETIVTLETNAGIIEGSLLVPNGALKTPVALIIAGSGPTDRDGNNPMMKNNCLKMLADELCKKGIASLRYDKRGVAKSQGAGLNESDLRFEHYIEDAKGWVGFLKEDKRFDQIIVVGHSEGSLIGMVASRDINVDQFISIAGAGQSADKILKEQLKTQPPVVLKMSEPIIDKLVQGQTVTDVDPGLYALFRPQVQPYLISWFQYDPGKEIAKLEKPVLIIQGTADIQVSIKDADLLAQGHPNAEKKIIKGMNHIFKEADADRAKNLQTYNEPDLPVKSELIEEIAGFIKTNKK